MQTNPISSPLSGDRGDLRILAACPLCQSNYHPLKTQIVGERDDEHLLYLVCRQCGAAVMAIVTTGVTGLSSIGILTDLTSQEIKTFNNDQPVTDNDVIDMYQWLISEYHLLANPIREKDLS